MLAYDTGFPRKYPTAVFVIYEGYGFSINPVYTIKDNRIYEGYGFSINPVYTIKD